jgi:hypothetical protein
MKLRIAALATIMCGAAAGRAGAVAPAAPLYNGTLYNPVAADIGSVERDVRST